MSPTSSLPHNNSYTMYFHHKIKKTTSRSCHVLVLSTLLYTKNQSLEGSEPWLYSEVEVKTSSKQPHSSTSSLLKQFTERNMPENGLIVLLYVELRKTWLGKQYVDF
jgi:hypothetical protein